MLVPDRVAGSSEEKRRNARGNSFSFLNLFFITSSAIVRARAFRFDKHSTKTCVTLGVFFQERGLRRATGFQLQMSFTFH